MNQSPQATYKQYLLRTFPNGTLIDYYGITIPKNIAQEVPKVKFNISFIKANEPITLQPGTYILLKSGLDLAQLKKEIDKYNIEDYE